MDMVTIMRKKRFIGQEFLTWLWYKSEMTDCFIVPRIGQIDMAIERRIVLESGSGIERKTVSCVGSDIDLSEAWAALREGKKVSQARFMINFEDFAWHVTLNDRGELRSVKMPKTFNPEEEVLESDAGKLLERIALLSNLTDIVDGLFASFINIRADENEWAIEVAKMADWMGMQ
jgi:recombination associated protein RdgC